MTTPRTIVEGALRLCQGVGRDAALSAADATEGLEALNFMLNGWEAESLLIPYRTSEDFTLVVGDATYTIGTGGDFNTTRPLAIEAIVLKDANGRRHPLRRITLTEFNQIPYRTEQAEPERFYYEPAYPLGTIELDTLPDAADTATITSRKPLTDLSLDTEISLPDMYMRAFKYNLAVELAPEYGRSVKPEVIAIARESKRAIEAQRAAQTVPTLDVDPVLWAGNDDYDIESDTV